jgi:hypothetical protein
MGVLGFKSLRGLGIFLFITVSRTALGPTQLPIQWVPGALSLGVKRLGLETNHSSPCSAEVKNAWSYTSTPQCFFIACCLVKHRGNFTFYLYNDQTTGWMAGIHFPAGAGTFFFPSPSPPDKLWGPPSLLSNGYRWEGLFPLR